MATKNPPHSIFFLAIGLLTNLLTFSDAHANEKVNNGAFQQRNLPDGCFTMRRTERSGFEEYYTGIRFTDPAEKPGTPKIPYPWEGSMIPKEAAFGDLMGNRIADIICIGNNISILTPLYANGGDVLILANRLDIRAPIDTRIYFNIANRARYNRNSSQMAPGYEEVFLRYHQTNPDSVSIGNVTYAPEYPSGGMIRVSGAPGAESLDAANGSPPPILIDEDRILAKSGSVTVFAKNIVISEEYATGVPQPSEICPRAKASKYAFQVGGVRGGKGGLGSLAGCPGLHKGGGFSCAASVYVNSGLSAPPGPGGDAGTVSIYKLGAVYSTTDITSLKNSANVSGGEGGPRAIYKMLDAHEMDAGVSTDFCNRQPVGTHPSADRGRDGIFRVGTSTVLQALEHAEAFATTSDARPSLDIKDLIERARLNYTVENRKMSEFLRSRLSRTALNSEKLWAQQLAILVQGQKPTELPNVEPFGSIGKDIANAKSTLLTNNIAALARRIAELDISPSDNLAASYFFNKGGAFSVTDTNATSSVNGKIVGEDLAAITLTTIEQLESLNKIEAAVSETLYTTRKNSVVEKLNAIQRRISEINAIPNKTGATFTEIVASIQKAAPAIAKFVGAVVSENYVAAASAYPAAMAGINDIYNTVYADVSNPTVRPGITELREAFSRLDEELKNMSALYIQERERLLTSQFYYAGQELAARHRVSSRVDGRLPLGEDLIKHSFVAYFIEPSRNINYLVENLLETAKFLDGRTEYHSMLRLPPISNDCQLNRVGEKNFSACLMLPASTQYRVIETKIGRLAFPAWIVAPNSKATVWPTFNTPMSVVKRKSRKDATRFMRP